jgi:hypothetical protein
MIRQALLIGHNDASAHRNGSLRGATKDMTDLRAFLLSNHGGAWEESEISWFGAPSRTTLGAAVAQARATCDYLFIAFSGHGAHDSRGSFVALNDEEIVYVRDLAQLGQRARRVVVISDACREQVTVPRHPPITVAGGDVAGFPNSAYRWSCRTGYDNALRSATEGVAVIFSCAAGETSGDSAQGGVFTQALLWSTLQWAEEESDGHRVRRVLYVRGAFNRVDLPPQRRVLPGHQTPRLGPANPPKFPFAIA